MIPDVYRYSQRLDGLMSTPPPTTWDGRSRSWGWQRPTSGWAPYRYEEIHLRDRLQAPTAAYLLGTDHVGRDLLSRLIHGARLSLTVGLAATVLTVVVAVLIGGTTGFIGGRLDLVTQRFVDAWMAFPGLLLLLTIMSITGRGMLGFGLPPDIPSWGGMLSREGRQYMEIAPHLALWPGLCLTVVVYSLNMFGDAVRDLLDPRLRGRLGRYGAGRDAS